METSGLRYVYHNTDVTTTLHGVIERIFLVKGENGHQRPPLPTTNIARRFARVKRRLHVGRLVDPMSDGAFVETYRGDSRKYGLYSRVMDELNNGRPLMRKDHIIQAFVKKEKVEEYNPHLASGKARVPRMIQPRSSYFHARLGPFIKPLEHEIYHRLNRATSDSVTVVKGLNAKQAGIVYDRYWDSFNNPVAVGLDAKRFDQHVSQAMLRWEHSVYLGMVPVEHRQYLNSLLSKQLVNTGYARCGDGTIKYKVQGCRMSGDMNTALGNCLIMSSAVISFAEHHNLKYKLLNNGDDCVFIVEERDLHLLQGIEQWFLELGFTLEVEAPCRVKERVQFCQSQFVFDGTSSVMVRHPRVCLAKDVLSVKRIESQVELDYYRGAIGACGLSLYGDMPILGSFYNSLRAGVRKVGQLEDSGFKRLAVGMRKVHSEPLAEVRESFSRAFGIDVAAQKALEEWYANVSYHYSDQGGEELQYTLLWPLLLPE